MRANVTTKTYTNKSALGGVFVLLIIMCTYTGVLAHPLGKFAISHFARLEVSSDQIKVRYVIDMAEIPTFQELQKLNSASNNPTRAEVDAYLKGLTAGYADGLFLEVDKVRLMLAVKSMVLTRTPGVAGMETMRIACDLFAAIPSQTPGVHTLRFEDRNYSERDGWREIVVSLIPGVSVFDSSVYASAISDELKSYPGDLAAPLDERRADLSFIHGSLPAGARPLLTRKGTPAVAARQDRLAELIQLPKLSLSLALLGMLIAFLWGALHALSPGHGKTVVAAYLVGSRGTVRHAGFLGLTVTITHTAGVLALGIITLMASEYILPERLLPPLGLISGMMVAVLGFSLLKSRLQGALGIHSAAQDVAESSHMHTHGGEPHNHTHLEDDHESDHALGQAHHHHHGEDQGQTHSHGGRPHTHQLPGADGSKITWRSLLALGISGGVVPCPSALVLLLGAISNNRTGFGLLLVSAFSIGLAGVLTAVGIAFVYAGRLMQLGGGGLGGRFESAAKLLPVVSALVITCAGLVICYGAMSQAGLFG